MIESATADTLGILSHDREQRSDIFWVDDDSLRFPSAIAARLAETPFVIVTSPSVDNLFGTRIDATLNDLHLSPASSRLVLTLSEFDKTLESVLTVCEYAHAAQLHKRSTIVAIGGGVCTDVCSLAAGLYRRGTSVIRVPTTLLGLVDSGIGAKSAVNHNGVKSLIGLFRLPEASLLNPWFIATLPRQQLKHGLSEIFKLAIACDAVLFENLEVHAQHSDPIASASADHVMLRYASSRMVSELGNNLFEEGAPPRELDFGHTFSPWFEAASKFQMHHGTAVALDMTLSIGIATALGHLSATDSERLLRTLEVFGLCLPVDTYLVIEELDRMLSFVETQRNGKLNLVLPRAIGHCTFLERRDTITQHLLSRALRVITSRTEGSDKHGSS